MSVRLPYDPAPPFVNYAWEGDGVSVPPEYEPVTAKEPNAPAWFWWRKTRFKTHRNEVMDVDPLLVELHKVRGKEFMTVKDVLAVLDAKDPKALVESWLGIRAESSVRDQPIGLPERQCAWTEGDYHCPQPVSAKGAKYCYLHARLSKRRSNRLTARKVRGGSGSRKSSPSLDPVK